MDEAVHAAAGAEHASRDFPPFDLSLFWHQGIWFVISFAALYIIMSRVALPGVARVVEKREGVIKGDLDAAAKASGQAEKRREDAEKAQAKAHAEARALIDDVRQKATSEMAAEQAKADEAIAKRIAAAEERIAKARADALKQVAGLADSVAADIADKLLPAGGR